MPARHLWPQRARGRPAPHGGGLPRPAGFWAHIDARVESPIVTFRLLEPPPRGPWRECEAWTSTWDPDDRSAQLAGGAPPSARPCQAAQLSLAGPRLRRSSSPSASRRHPAGRRPLPRNPLSSTRPGSAGPGGARCSRAPATATSWPTPWSSCTCGARTAPSAGSATTARPRPAVLSPSPPLPPPTTPTPICPRRSWNAPAKPPAARPALLAKCHRLAPVAAPVAANPP
jgi:hypothetical protein